MAIYLGTVYGLSLWAAGWRGAVEPLGAHPEIPGFTRTVLDALGALTGTSLLAHAMVAVPLIYACMLAIFHVTRLLVRGPIWLGSLAGTSFMAHPVKTEALFEAIGVYYLAAALMALLSVCAYLRVIERPSPGRIAAALAIFALAAFPFAINAPLFGVLLLLEFYPARPESRNWLRLAPFLAVATLANGLHIEAVYSTLPSPVAMAAPLILLIYPIGLLPETVAHLHAHPMIAWSWGLFALVLVAIAFIFVRNGAFRLCLIAIFAFRFFPGVEPIDYTTLAGGAQLAFPLALGCIALAGFSRWLMRFEPWGTPVVALTTMLCVALFVLQITAHRDWAPLRGEVPPGVERPAANGTGL